MRKDDGDERPSLEPMLERARRRSPDADAFCPARTLDSLFRTEQPRLARSLRKKVGNPDEAADIVQDAFARLAGKPPEALSKPKAYLQRIVRNLLIDRGKRPERRIMVAFDGRALPEVPAAPDQSWAIERADLSAQYRAALAELPPRAREVFLLHRVEELRYRDIADRLGISLATVEYHMARALSQLAKALDR